MINIETILDHYIICALWASTDNNQYPLDDNYCESDISPGTLEAMREDIIDFVNSNLSLLLESKQTEEQIGHDFWLTRNSHGAGFWDRGLGAVGEELSKASKVYGSFDLYIGDDEKVYGS